MTTHRNINIFSLDLPWLIILSGIFTTFLTIAAIFTLMQQIKNISSTMSTVYLSGIIILWSISIILTIADGKRTTQTDNFKWTRVGVVAASLTTILSFFLLAYTSMASISVLKFNNLEVEYESSQETHSQFTNNFYEYIYFGGSPSDPYKLPAPPEGQGILRGRILYDKGPAEAVTLQIVLNSKYRTKNIITDSNGFFTVKLAAGNYRINSIQTESWQNKPDGNNFTIYGGGEAKLIGDRFNRHNRFQNDGVRVAIDENNDTIHISLVIKKDIELLWPDEDIVGVDATISDTINWEPYPLAAKYFVEIQHLRREGTTTHFNKVTSKVLSSETSIPLSNLKHIKTNGKEIQEYAVEVYAFSENGSLIGEHSDTFRGGTFILTDGYMLVEDELQNWFDDSSGENPETFQKKMELISLDRRRIDAVEILIDDNMLSAAEALLKTINSEFSNGKKEVLSGYILALKGNCPESNTMFNMALTINPDVCIPDRYRKICEQYESN